VLAARLDEMAHGGQSAICGVISPRDGHGPRYLIEGEGDRPYLRMNSNSYLGMALILSWSCAVGAERTRLGKVVTNGGRWWVKLQ
jgi:hypothetical protein